MFRMPPISQNPYLIVALGGALGSMMRYGAAVLFGASPLTTFLVNVTGSFCIGALAASTGSTTISAFCLERAYLAASQRSQPGNSKQCCRFGCAVSRKRHSGFCSGVSEPALRPAG